MPLESPGIFAWPSMVSSQEDILTLVPKDRRLPPLRSFQRLIEELVAVHTQEVDLLQTEIEQLRQSIPSGSPLLSHGNSQENLAPPEILGLSPPIEEVVHDEQLVVEPAESPIRSAKTFDIATASRASKASFMSTGSNPLDLDSDSSDEQPNEQEVARMSRIQAFFLSSSFESMVAILLFINICVMAMQLQFLGLQNGYNIGIERYSTPPDQAWPYADTVFFICDITFAALFTLEMMIRQFYLRLTFFKYFLNWLDFLVVCSSWIELFAAGLPINPTFLRMLRLGKLLRAIRVVRMSQVLESLQLLLKCIAASVKILFWSLFLLMIIQISAGMSISYLVSEYLVDPTVDIKNREAVFRYYGSFTKTLLTMFEVLFANWAPPCRVLIDNVSEWYALVFVIYRCFVGFAVLNVVNAVFVQSTMKVAQADEEFILLEKKKAEQAYRRKVNSLFRQVDTSGDGKIDAHEFKRLLKAPKLQAWLTQLEIETNDLWGLFKMLDQGEGEISLKDFEDGTMRIKGLARSYDVAQLQISVQRIQQKLENLLTERTGERRDVNDRHDYLSYY
ncbi:unnamed protein product [Durusdinium trenchii]|uniref:EF-hand domain-containing protein n=1 Tax=Durusdinium trenchii TaxID=1381693 RepID=A0ABP0SMU0_9DINO